MHKLVLDAPHYPPDETGFRFWKYADIGPRISDGDQLLDAVLQANYNSASYSIIGAAMTAEVFGEIDGSAQQAAEAIQAVFT